MTTTEEIRPGLRAVLNEDGAIIRYESRVDGNWYDADNNGTLTAKGNMQKAAAESSDGGGGGGGGC